MSENNGSERRDRNATLGEEHGVRGPESSKATRGNFCEAKQTPRPNSKRRERELPMDLFSDR